MFSGLTRLLCCYLLFGLGAAGLAPVVGDTPAVILSAIVALAVNRVWRQQQHADARREHARDVIADEQLRLEVRERRRDEGREA